MTLRKPSRQNTLKLSQRTWWPGSRSSTYPRCHTLWGQAGKGDFGVRGGKICCIAYGSLQAGDCPLGLLPPGSSGLLSDRLSQALATTQTLCHQCPVWRLGVESVMHAIAQT